ncbi:MAG: alpha-D-ribose 1-methylphosphonate 5-triphosphate diphosphatase [Aestuariivirga sp.]
MVTASVLANAHIVLADEIIFGSIRINDGRIDAISSGAARAADDLEGDYLIPGLVELHTDHLESHYHPRPGVEWPAEPAVIAHDAQIAATGITTVFDALRAGSFDPGDVSAGNGEKLCAAIHAVQAAGSLRAEHHIHLRCELPCADTVEAAERTLAAGDVRLISVMDHTPGVRQFVSIEKFKEYYLGKKLVLPEKIDAYIAEKQALQSAHSAYNKRGILDLASRFGIRLASHDDATVEHIDEAVADGVVIAEFPTTDEACQAAHLHGLAVMMGAPNVVRGGSHSGNISAQAVAASGQLDILSSDYVPSSLLMAAFALPQMIDFITLPQALAFVTVNPARVAGLGDRGDIATGKRADLVQVSVRTGMPVVRRVWRNGIRVL